MKVLVVEDNAISQVLLQKILQTRPGCEVSVAGDGRISWELLEKGLRPDLILLDVMMPNMGGMEFLQRVRKDDRFKSIKVIICSALRDRETIAQGAAMGIEYYVLKPFKAELLLDQVDKVLKNLEIICDDQDGRLAQRLGVDDYTLRRSLLTLNDEVRRGIGGIRSALASSVVGMAKLPATRLDQLNMADPERRTMMGHIEAIRALIDQIERENTELNKKVPEFGFPASMSM